MENSSKATEKLNTKRAKGWPCFFNFSYIVRNLFERLWRSLKDPLATDSLWDIGPFRFNKSIMSHCFLAKKNALFFFHISMHSLEANAEALRYLFGAISTLKHVSLNSEGYSTEERSKARDNHKMRSQERSLRKVWMVSLKRQIESLWKNTENVPCSHFPAVAKVRTERDRGNASPIWWDNRNKAIDYCFMPILRCIPLWLLRTDADSGSIQ